MKSLISILIIATLAIPSFADAKTINLKDYPIVVGCKNVKTGKFVDPKNSSVEDGACLI